MRTRLNRRSPYVVAGVALAAASIAALSFAFLTGSAGVQAVDATAYRLPNDDLGVLGDVSLGTPPLNAIATEAAISSASLEYDPKALGATDVRAFLETVTVRGTLGSDEPIRDRAVWIVRMNGMTVEQGGPATEDGTPVAGHVLRTAYVFVDAVSAQVLMAVWTE